MSNNADTKEKNNLMQGGMIFYPREYLINEESDDKSYCKGVDESGKECIVYIKPPYEAKMSARRIDSNKAIPTLSEFSEDDRGAKNPCIATPDNGPDNPAGILMLERLKVDEKASKEHNLPVHIGGWASVIRTDEKSPDAPIGFGYLEINMGNKIADDIQQLVPEYEKLRQTIVIDQKELSDESQLRFQTLGQAIIEARYKWFVAVVTHPEEMITLDVSNTDKLKESLLSSMEKYTKNGQYGGNMVRVRDGKKILMHLTAQCDQQYDYQKKCIKDANVIIDDFMKYNGKRMINIFSKNKNLVIDIIPTQRINSQISNGRFSDELKNSMGSNPGKILKTYVDKKHHDNAMMDLRKDKGQLYTKVAIRLAAIRRGAGKGNELLSSIHSYTGPINNPYSMNKNGEPEYSLFTFENKKKYDNDPSPSM